MWGFFVFFLLPLASCGVGGLIYATAVSLGQDTLLKMFLISGFFTG